MCAKSMQNANVCKGQKLTHSPAHVEKHTGQRTFYTVFSTVSLR